MKKLSYIFRLAKQSGKQGLTLKKRLLLYLLSMSLLVLGIMTMVLIASGAVFGGEAQASEKIALQSEHTTAALQETIDIMMGHSHYLAETLGREIDNFLGTGRDIRRLNNSAKELTALQKELYGELNATLKLARSSGCFAVVDATVNTELPDAKYSKAGLYLRLSNVNSNVQLNPEIFVFRGSAEIAREKGLQLHNRWNLEFNLKGIPFFDAAVEHPEKLTAFWAEKIHFQNTWEDAVIYLVPIAGEEGDVYGVCGLDLSALFMELSYPVTESGFGPMITVLAPLKNGVLKTGEGLVGGQGGTWLDGMPDLVVKEKGRLMTFKCGDASFVGAYRFLSMPGRDGQQWVSAVLVPEAPYREFLAGKRRQLLLAVAVFILLTAGLSVLIVKRYVDPIANSLASIRSGEDMSNITTGIPEIDVVIEFLNSKSRTEPISVQELPPEIEELFASFAAGVKQLTGAEYHVFRFYVDGYTIAEIPELAFISMSTVKKHNRNIYEKLRISSYEELMLFLDLFRRCDRMEELER